RHLRPRRRGRGGQQPPQLRQRDGRRLPLLSDRDDAPQRSLLVQRLLRLERRRHPLARHSLHPADLRRRGDRPPLPSQRPLLGPRAPRAPRAPRHTPRSSPTGARSPRRFASTARAYSTTRPSASSWPIPASLTSCATTSARSWPPRSLASAAWSSYASASARA